MLTEAIAAARAGDRARARELLTRLLRSDSATAEYWVWMSSVVDSDRESIYCLESALKLDPTNRAALRGLVVLGARKPEPGDLAAALRIPRRQLAALPSAPRLRSRFDWRLIGTSSLGLVLLVLIGTLAVNLFRARGFAIAPTLPPVSPTATSEDDVRLPTFTPVPPSTLVMRTPVPTELAGTPLAFFAHFTTTPTQQLGATPHPEIEAYGAGLEAMRREDFEEAVRYFQQVVELNPRLPDAHYLLGEANRRLGRTRSAAEAFSRAISLGPDYAPGYYGRGLLILAADPSLTSPPDDFNRALQRDPQLVEAYLTLAEFYSARRLWNTMQTMLQRAIDAGVEDPMVFVRLSEAQFQRGDFEAALESAIRGSAADPTLLDGYLAIGRAYVELETYTAGLWSLQTYVAYRPEDHRGWTMLGRAMLGGRDIEGALAALDRALEINERYAPAYLARAQVRIEQGEYQAALTDVQSATRFGSTTFDLLLTTGRVNYHLGNLASALRAANDAMGMARNRRDTADGYALRAQIYETTNPPQIDQAIANWDWALSVEQARPEVHDLATARLLALRGSAPTPPPSRTPTPTRTPTATRTATAGPSPTPTP